MTQAALVIQNRYRSYCANKRYKNDESLDAGASTHSDVGASASPLETSGSLDTSAAALTSEDEQSRQCLHNYFTSLQQAGGKTKSQVTTVKEPSPSGPLK